ncbi:MAG: c-type cytochrome [Nitrospirae bacterium]|nr:c-type cytochrome [Candidatus Troglogloeales bacterium]
MIRKGFLSAILVASALFFLSPNPAISSDDVVGGRHIFEHYCAVCHGKAGKGDGVNAKMLDPHPSNLAGSEVASRSDKEIYDVIEKGGAGVDLAATMPPWGKTFSLDQIKELVAYVRLLQKGAPVPQGVRLSDLKGSEKEQCSVCHVEKGKARQIAPNLGHEGSKFNRDWLFQFLKHPDRVRPNGYMPITKTRMPNFNLSDEDAGALTAYLMTLKEERFSAVSNLDQSEKAVSEGKSLFSDIYRCDGCHKISEKGEGGIVGPHLSIAKARLKPEWIYAWLKNPQSIRPDSPMPNFGLPEQDIRSLMAYVLSLGGEGKPASVDAGSKEELAKQGKELVEKKNCLFCHILESSGGATKVSESLLSQKKGK